MLCHMSRLALSPIPPPTNSPCEHYNRQQDRHRNLMIGVNEAVIKEKVKTHRLCGWTKEQLQTNYVKQEDMLYEERKRVADYSLKVKNYETENKKIKEQFERWKKTQEYIDKNETRITEDLYREVHKLKQEIKKLKKEELELEELELDKMLDASLNEIF